MADPAAGKPKAFRSISEAAADVGVPSHVLRFWESRFDFIQPTKRAGGRRFYRAADIDLLRAIRRRLHDEGLTLKGVQRLFDEAGVDGVTGAVTVAAPALSPTTETEFVGATPGLARALAQVEYARARLLAALAG